MEIANSHQNPTLGHLGAWNFEFTLPIKCGTTPHRQNNIQRKTHTWDPLYHFVVGSKFPLPTCANTSMGMNTRHSTRHYTMSLAMRMQRHLNAPLPHAMSLSSETNHCVQMQTTMTNNNSCKLSSFSCVLPCGISLSPWRGLSFGHPERGCLFRPERGRRAHSAGLCAHSAGLSARHQVTGTVQVWCGAVGYGAVRLLSADGSTFVGLEAAAAGADARSSMSR